jgi:hypothetical protein
VSCRAQLLDGLRDTIAQVGCVRISRACRSNREIGGDKPRFRSVSGDQALAGDANVGFRKSLGAPGMVCGSLTAYLSQIQIHYGKFATNFPREPRQN